MGIMVPNPFSCFAGGDRLLFVKSESCTTRKEIGLWTSVEDKDIIIAARMIFGLQGMAILRGPEKDAFITLCFDLWEEAHGKSR